MNSIKLHPSILALILSWIPVSLILIWSIIPSVTINIIILLLLILWIPISIFIIWNSIKKFDKMEEWTQLYIAKIVQVQQDLSNIDSTGHFESDDEIGAIFSQIKEIINSLSSIIEDEKITTKK